MGKRPRFTSEQAKAAIRARYQRDPEFVERRLRDLEWVRPRLTADQIRRLRALIDEAEAQESD